MGGSHVHEEMLARLEERIRDAGLQDRIGYTPVEVSVRVAKFATLLGLDALEAVRGDKTLEELEDRREALAHVNDEVDQTRSRLDPTGDAFVVSESAEGDG